MQSSLYPLFILSHIVTSFLSIASCMMSPGVANYLGTREGYDHSTTGISKATAIIVYTFLFRSSFSLKTLIF